jgi:signal transduction histidine kinase
VIFKPCLRVDVADDGVGMDLDIQRQLFTPFFTTKGKGGTGLGLASAHASVRRHGGTIFVSSTPGKGSHFRINLPAFAGGQRY